MDGTAGELLAGLESLALRRRPGKSGSRRVDVDDPALPAGHKAGVENPQKSGQGVRSTRLSTRSSAAGDRVERGFCKHLLGIGFDALIIKGEASNRLIGDLKMPISTLPY